MFRANVGVILANKNGEVLALERVRIPGAWQMPQGGIQDHEEPIDAAKRELQEETGISPGQIEFVAECPEWLAYELPRDKWSAKTGRGQVQKWFLFKVRDSEVQISLDRNEEIEFSAWRWMKLSELVTITVAFRQNIYRKLLQVFAGYLEL